MKSLIILSIVFLSAYSSFAISSSEKNAEFIFCGGEMAPSIDWSYDISVKGNLATFYGSGLLNGTEQGTGHYFGVLKTKTLSSRGHIVQVYDLYNVSQIPNLDKVAGQLKIEIEANSFIVTLPGFIPKADERDKVVKCPL